jgi:polar amino acid transport system substrate-binding protein
MRVLPPAVRAFALAACVLCAATACGRPPESSDLWENATIRRAKEAGRLVVALEPVFPPFEGKDASGNLVGFDVDLAREIGTALGVEVRFREVKFDAIMLELQTGRADLVISGMTVTPERALTVSFTRPYYHTVTCLLVSRSRGADVKTVADLNREGRIVTTKLASTGEQAARRVCPKATLRTYEAEYAALLEVAQGRADAMLFDLVWLRTHHGNHAEHTFLLTDPVTVEPYGIALRKGDPESVAWLDLFLDHLKVTGRLEEWP